LKTSAKIIAKYLNKRTRVFLESTTYPGTTEEVLKPVLELGSGLICREDFYLEFAPERVDPGNLIF
jgi:UDP-N-acetyl-D-glucosamine dehydrogenase